jgi:hypothetical protein
LGLDAGWTLHRSSPPVLKQGIKHRSRLRASKSRVPLAPHVPYTWRILRTLGLDHFVSDIRPISI